VLGCHHVLFYITVARFGDDDRMPEAGHRTFERPFDRLGNGKVSDRLSNKSLLNKLPLVGPVLGRIDVPGRPKWRGEGNTATSPEYPYLFAAPLPIPEIAKPLFTETVNGVPIDYYEMTIESFDTQLFPDRGPTTLTG
jgi:hypothetical protein